MAITSKFSVICTGNSSSCVLFFELLQKNIPDARFLKSLPSQNLECDILWIQLSSPNLNWSALEEVYGKRVAIFLEQGFLENQSPLVLSSFIQEAEKHFQSNLVWFCETQNLIYAISPYIELSSVKELPLKLPLSPSINRVRLPSKKIQLGLVLHDAPDQKLQSLLTELCSNENINVRIWETRKIPDESYAAYPTSWSLYRGKTYDFKHFSNLCDILIVANEHIDIRYIDVALGQGTICYSQTPLNENCRSLEKLFDDLKSFQETPSLLKKEGSQLKSDFYANNGWEAFISHTGIFSDFTKSIATDVSVPPQNKTRILFVSTNGIGLGHITRLLAIAKRCPEEIEPIFAVFSAGVRLVKEAGYICEHLVSNEYAEVEPSGWQEHTDYELSAFIRYYKPQAIIYDGNALYPGVTRAFSRANLPFFWVRRGLFRKEAPYGPLTSQVYVDSLIEPGELAKDYDEGPTSHQESHPHWPRQYNRVAPITWITPSEILEKASAQNALGIKGSGLKVLLQVGAGNLKDTDRQIDLVMGLLKKHAKVDCFLAQWPISDRPPIAHSDLTPLNQYPLSPYLKAFDFVISATGYNSFHELMLLNIPSLLIPNEFTRLDDQQARARYAQDNGLSFFALGEDKHAIEQAILKLLDNHEREQLQENMKKITWEDGAQEIVQLLLDFHKERSLADEL